MVPSVANIKFVKYNISHRSEEAKLCVMVKACLHLKKFPLLKAQKDYFLVIYKKVQNL